MPDWLFTAAFTLGGAPATWLEIAAVALALAMVACNIREVHWGWPLAAASSVLYLLLFTHSRLYGEAGLQVFFAVVALWGWAQWLHGGPGGAPLVVRRLPSPARGPTLLAGLGAWLLTGFFLDHFTDSDLPWADAFPTALSVIGQVLLGRKFIENWPIWLVVNVFSVGLFAWKSLWLTAGLYALFAVLSLLGWRAWRRKMNLPLAPDA
jgi:nicotinamide mononucleotide transporter